MVSSKVTVTNPTGLQLKPAGLLCDEAMKYSCSIHFSSKGNVNSNAKSVLSVLGACVRFGEELEFTCDGEDEEEALSAIIKLFESGMD